MSEPSLTFKSNKHHFESKQALHQCILHYVWTKPLSPTSLIVNQNKLYNDASCTISEPKEALL